MRPRLPYERERERAKSPQSLSFFARYNSRSQATRAANGPTRASGPQTRGERRWLFKRALSKRYIYPRRASGSSGYARVSRGDQNQRPLCECVLLVVSTKENTPPVLSSSSRVGLLHAAKEPSGAAEDRVHVLSALQEISTNVDTIAITPPATAPAQRPRVRETIFFFSFFFPSFSLPRIPPTRRSCRASRSCSSCPRSSTSNSTPATSPSAASASSAKPRARSLSLSQKEEGGETLATTDGNKQKNGLVSRTEFRKPTRGGGAQAPARVLRVGLRARRGDRHRRGPLALVPRVLPRVSPGRTQAREQGLQDRQRRSRRVLPPHKTRPRRHALTSLLYDRLV